MVSGRTYGFIAAMLAALLPATLSAQAPDIDPARLSAHVRELASDAYDGRAPGTAGEEKTVRYLERAFADAGLQPGGDLLADGSRAWTQAVPLRRSDIEGIPTIDVHRGTASAWRLRQGEDIAVRAAVTGVERVHIAAAPLVFVGHGIHAPERGHDDYKGVDLTGKVAVVLISDPVPLDSADGRRHMSQHGHSRAKYEQAARRGALGVLIVHEADVVGYGWNAAADSNTATMYDVLRERPADVHPPLEAWISQPAAERLLAAAGQDLAALRERARDPRFTPVELVGLTLSVDLRLRTSIIRSHNVVARLEGTAWPDDTLIYSAHWDHIGSQVHADGRREVFHGAIDNATGVAALIELARAFAAEPRPRRSLLFIAWTAEEKGLLGAEHYVEHPLSPLATTVGVVNMDVLSPHGPSRDVGMLGSARLDLLDALVDVARQAGVAFSADPQPEAGFFFRSDHYAFVRAGVPALTLRSGLDQPQGGSAAGLAAMVDYLAHRYHRSEDQWQADWPFTGIARDLALLRTLGHRLGNARTWPEWGADEPAARVRAHSADQRR